MPQLFSVSVGEIEHDVISYFVKTHGTPLSALTPATNLRQMYRFKPPAWAQLADTLSNLPWMLHLGVRLSQGEMGTVATVAQLSYLIFTKLRHVVAPPASENVAPITALMALSPHALASAGAPVSAGRPARGSTSPKIRRKRKAKRPNART